MASTVAVRGGVLTVTGTATISQLDLDGGVTTAGLVSHESSGTITTLNVRGGRFDGRANPSSVVTVTNAAIWSGELDIRSGLDNYTFSNGIDIRGDGLVYAEPGSTLTIT
jgi:hypothetical protein